MPSPEGSEQSIQLSQPSIFDWVRSGSSEANSSQQDSPAIGSRTRSKVNANLPERTDQLSNKQRKTEKQRQRKARRSTQNATRNLQKINENRGC